MGSSELCSVRANLMCAVRAHQTITVQNIKDSFSKTGLWPTKFDFANRLRTTADIHKKHAASIKDKSEGEGVIPLRSLKRTDDESTDREISDVMKKNIGPSRKLQAVQIILKRSQTVNDVVMGIGQGLGSQRSSIGRGDKESKVEQNVETFLVGGEGYSQNSRRGGVLTAGTPAVYLTHTETIIEREKKIREAQEAQTEKVRIEEQKKLRERQAVERAAKRIERKKRKVERQRASEGASCR